MESELAEEAVVDVVCAHTAECLAPFHSPDSVTAVARKVTGRDWCSNYVCQRRYSGGGTVIAHFFR